MERKFASKLSQLRPAAEARKQAQSQLKENIQLNKLKQIEPIDYDIYIEQNLANLKKDSCSKQLILLPSDDLVFIDSENAPSTSIYLNKFQFNNLFLNDCLRTYLNLKYEFKFKYHSFGGSYRQLPLYLEHANNFLASLTLINDKKINKNILIPEHNFEIDVDQEKIESSAYVKYSGKFEKQGWLMYKQINILSDKEKNFKRRYFHLRTSNSPIQSRSNTIDTQHHHNHNQNSSKFIYILECFKEVPGLKRNENPKHQIFFDSNIINIQKTWNKYGAYSFEVIESLSANMNSSILKPIENQSNQSHIFIADNQKQFDEWYNKLENIIKSSKKETDLMPETMSSPSTASPSSQSNNSSNLDSNLSVSSVKQEDSSSSQLNESTSSNEISILAGSRGFNEQTKLITDSNQQFINSFDLNKYLNENEEDLLLNKTNFEQLNTFDFYPKTETSLLDEETELECNWPEEQIGQKLLLNCSNFKLNLHFPVLAPDSPSIKLNETLTQNLMNPELFFISFCLYDCKNFQKISSNFNWIPNYEQFLTQLLTQSKSTIFKQNSVLTTSIHKKFDSKPDSNIFSLNGLDFSDNPGSVLNSDVKLSFLSKLSKALFTVLDIHEEIYLVGRVEKLLDGNNLHQSIQPYLIQMNESNKIKAAVKLNKKMQQLIKTKLSSYRQPFAWLARPVYKKVQNTFELDNDSKFQIYEQEVQHLSDDDLYKYLSDFSLKEKYLNKLTPLQADLKIQLSLVDKLDKFCLINTNLEFINKNKHSEYVLMTDNFEPTISINPNSLENLNTKSESEISTEQKKQIKKAKLIKINSEFKSFLYVYPKSLKYDTQKVYNRARNILIKIEFRDRDSPADDFNCLKCIFKLNPGFINDQNSCFVSNYKTLITHHNKTPQFYDEVKILLPLNIHEKHHLLFKFYHISCTSAKQALIDRLDDLKETSLIEEQNFSDKTIETLIGYAWLPIFKNGRLITGEKILPVSQNLPNNYLSFEQIGLGQSVGPSDIKWVENMKPLFRINLVPNSTVHTVDPHVANFYSQYEKLTQTILKNDNESSDCSKSIVTRNISKRVAPTLVNGSPVSQQDDILLISNSNKEKITNSVKLPINMLWSKPVKEELSLSYHLKALHATEITTIIKFMPTLLNRILNTLITTVSGDVALHSVKAVLHFIWQITSIGKIDNLKSFIKYIFYVDYSSYFKEINQVPNLPSIHEEIILNLYLLIKQNNPIQDSVQLNRLFKNCWFFLEITIKSICLYTIQFKKHFNTKSNPTFNPDFYTSIKNLYDIFTELMVKNVSQSSKEAEFLNSFKSCNRSLAMFVKKCLNILNKKFLFILIGRYLENIHTNDKQLFELKYDFIKIICNHEHYISFSLPIRKSISNINEFGDIKYEFILSDQFRQFHFLVGVLLSQLCIALNENKDQRKAPIHIFRNILCKHSYDSRYIDKIKQARIASLYIPFIDILIENLPRLTGNMNATGNLVKSVANQSLDSTNVSRTLSVVSNSTNTTLIAQSNPYTASSTTSISNGSVYGSNYENGSKLVYDPLSVIAGIVNPNKLQDHLDSIIGAMSDNDSLSSADDFKHINSKRASSSFTTSSDTTAFTNSNSNTQDQQSIAKSYCMTRKDKLETNEIKDLLICVVYILKNISDDCLLGLWYNYDDNEFAEFFTLLELCLTTFRYRGKNYIQKLNAISKGQDVKSLIKSPRNQLNENAGIQNRFSHYETFDKITNSAVNFTSKLDSLKQSFYNSNSLNKIKEQATISLVNSNSDFNQLSTTVVIESNLSHQVGLVILNILSLFLIHQKEKIFENNGDNLITKKLFDIYFYLLQSNQSEMIKLRVFTSLRLMINKIPSIFLDGQTTHCSNLCLELLKCFNSKFESIRVESTVVIYLLLRKNYEQTKLKSIARVHSQTIISVSKLIGNMKLTSNNQVLECLSILNHLAFNDQIFLNTRFALEVDDLTKRIRNIFMATSQMKSFQEDSEMLIDSQYSLAKSYANCLELRKTWLESMAIIHIKEKNYSEAAHCYLHIAALVADNLKHQGLYTLGCSVFKKITPNIELDEEINKKNDVLNQTDNYFYFSNELNDVQYTQSQLLDYLCKSADMLKLAERYDFLPDIFKLAVAIYEPNRDYEHLQQMHMNIQKAYSYLADRDQKSKEKPLAAYYRVSFYGKSFEQENNKVYIYKEPSSTKLFEICDRLKKIYSKRFGSAESVEILSDSRKPNELKLDTENKNYIQVTYVQPYFEDVDFNSNQFNTNRISYFDKNNNLKKFYYETPYQLKDDDKNSSDVIQLQPQQHSELLKLCKRKIILETSNWFPYVKKRILVVYEMPIELNPIETAIDEIKQKIEDFESILRKKDITLLELYLQGGIMPQVHKGPLAYAEAFLEPNEFNSKYSKELKKKFKTTFKRLIDLYKKGIESYQQLALKATNNNSNNNNNNNQNDQIDNKTSILSINNHVVNNNSTNNNNNNNNNNTNALNNKHIEMYRLLNEKFNELENNFRNLLLIDGDFELYQQQLNNSQGVKFQQVLIDLANSSQA